MGSYCKWSLQVYFLFGCERYAYRVCSCKLIKEWKPEEFRLQNLNTIKHLYRLVVSLLLFVGFQSCVDEDGAGVPSPKSLIIEADEYTLDMTDLTTPQFIAFRWVDVGNATYTVAFTKASDSDTENIVTEVLNNEVTVEEELNVLSMTISKVQLKDYLTKAGFTQTGTYDVVISITATPIDLSISTALAEEGSVKTAVIHVTRD